MKALSLLLPALVLFTVSGCATVKKTDAAAPAPAKTAEQKTVKAAPTEGPSGSALLCKHEKDERTLEIKSEGKGCSLSYTKFGKSSVIASSTNGEKHCEDVKAKVQKSLENSAFKCQ